MTPHLSNIDPRLRDRYLKIMGEDLALPRPKAPSVQPPRVSQSAVDSFVKKRVYGDQPATNISLLYILAAILLLAGYTIFWIKVFNFKMPFPLPF